MKIFRTGREVSSKLSNIFRGIAPTASGWGDGPIQYAYLDDGGVFADDTTDANSAAANDVPLMPAAEAVNDAFYFGMDRTFTYIKINIGTAGVGNTIAWEYWNGSAWVALTCTDNTSGFTAAGTNTVTFTAPTNWAATTVNGQSAYWIRARVTAANFTTQPLATQIWIDGAPDALSNATDGLMSTVTGTGNQSKAVSGDFGYYTFDLGSIKTVLVGGRTGIWSTANTVQICIEASDDDITYVPSGNATGENSASVTEVIRDLIPKILTGRYIRVRYAISGAAVAYARLYSMMGYELMP